MTRGHARLFVRGEEFPPRAKAEDGVSILLPSRTPVNSMMPDGSYRMSQSSAAGAVNLGRQNVSDFLRSKAIKGLLGEGYTGQISEIEVDSTEQSRGQTRINALPLEAVTAYWVWQSHRGNKKALALVIALTTETLERRFDNAFGVERTEPEYNQRLSDRVKQLQGDMERLGDAYAEPDVQREYILRLEAQVRRLGEEPVQLPEQDV